MKTERKTTEHTILYYISKYEKLKQWSAEVNLEDCFADLYPTVVEFKNAWESYMVCCQYERAKRHSSPMDYRKKDIMRQDITKLLEKSSKEGA